MYEGRSIGEAGDCSPSGWSVTQEYKRKKNTPSSGRIKTMFFSCLVLSHLLLSQYKEGQT